MWARLPHGGPALKRTERELTAFDPPQIISYETVSATDYTLTSEGAEIATRGSHEAVLWAALPAQGEGAPLGIPELKVRVLGGGLCRGIATGEGIGH